MLVDNVKNMASKALSAILRYLRKELPELDFVVTYADMAQGHEGTIYKAISGIEAGDTGRSIRVVGGGRVFSGRYLAQSIENSGVNIDECRVEIVDGKKRFLLPMRMTRDDLIKLMSQLS